MCWNVLSVLNAMSTRSLTGLTPLVLASQNGPKDVVALLVENGTNLVGTAQFIMKAGADANLHTKEG